MQILYTNYTCWQARAISEACFGGAQGNRHTQLLAAGLVKIVRNQADLKESIDLPQQDQSLFVKQRGCLNRASCYWGLKALIDGDLEKLKNIGNKILPNYPQMFVRMGMATYATLWTCLWGKNMQLNSADPIRKCLQVMATIWWCRSILLIDADRIIMNSI